MQSKVLRLLARDLRTSLFFRPRFWIVQLTYPLFYVYVGGVIYNELIPNAQLGIGNIPYIAFLAVGLIVVQVFQGAGSSASMFYSDKRNRMFEQIMAGPFTTRMYVISKMLSVVLQSALNSLIFLVMVLPVIWPYIHLSLLSIGLVSVSIFFGAVFFAGFHMTLVSMPGTSQEIYGRVAAAILFPVMFLSSSFYPLAVAPPLLRTIGLFNPLTYSADLMRAGILGYFTAYTTIELVVLVMEAMALTIVAFYFFSRRNISAYEG